EEEEASGELSPETTYHYAAYIRIYYMPFFKDMDITEIKFEHLERFKDKLPKKLRIKTKRNILNALHSFFGWLRNKGVIGELPRFPEIKGNDAKSRTAIDYETQTHVLQRFPEDYRDVFIFAFETGLRPGETSALRVSDVFINQQ
ncbi:MAG: hypothetical protein HQK96_21600, partial [Nitrospirae bacterium]|nr:hypothetical protein [Nitrospirota bacterium]